MASERIPPTITATLFSDEKKKESSDESGGAALSVDTTDLTPFEQKPLVLASLAGSKSLQCLEATGGTEGLLRSLSTDANFGLRSWQYADSSQRYDLGKGEGGDSPHRATADGRRRIYGVNQTPSRKSKGLWLWMWLTLKDKQLVFLSVAAVVELALGLYFGSDAPPEGVLCDDSVDNCAAPPVDWVEGIVVMIAVLLIVVIGSLGDWQIERQFCKLNDRKEGRNVKVVRDSKEQVINVKDLMVGDIALLEPGEIIPCDGVFLCGHNVRCDQSGSTGESDATKVTYEECTVETRALKPGEKPKLDCFSAKVLEGVGRYVVIAVGPTFNGRTMTALYGDAERTALQLRLKALAKSIEQFGYGASLILFTVLVIKAFIQSKANPDLTQNDKATVVLHILVTCVTLTVVAVPEGLPLAVTLVLAFVTRRMLQEGLVRVLSSCKAIPNASVICADETGTLTQNDIPVDACSVCIHGKFMQRLSKDKGRQNVGHVVDNQDINSEYSRKHKGNFPLDISKLNTVIPIMWGRCVNDSIRKFLQFQVPVNITAVLITFISAIASDEQASFLAPVQVLWINIIMGTFTALALTTDPACPELLKCMPGRNTAPLFSVDMGKMIIGQSLYQTVVILLLHFAGPKFWGHHTEKGDAALSTMIFNTFVFCQIFNSINCRSLTQDKNIFRGLTKNWYFIAITLIEVGIQILIVCVGGSVFQVTPMNGRDWGISIALGFVSIPLGFLIRCIPTPPIERLLIALHIMRDPVVRSKPTEAEMAKV